MPVFHVWFLSLDYILVITTYTFVLLITLVNNDIKSSFKHTEEVVFKMLELFIDNIFV